MRRLSLATGLGLVLLGLACCATAVYAAMCIGGPNDTNSCSAASECPSGACGATPTATPTPTATSVTPTPTPTRTPQMDINCGAGSAAGGAKSGGVCGGLCPINQACVWDNSTTNAGCMCAATTSSCEGLGAAACGVGYCDRPPTMVGGNCVARAGRCRCE